MTNGFVRVRGMLQDLQNATQKKINMAKHIETFGLERIDEQIRNIDQKIHEIIIKENEVDLHERQQRY